MIVNRIITKNLLLQQAGKKEGVWGKEFLPACHPAKRDWGGSGSSFFAQKRFAHFQTKGTM